MTMIVMRQMVVMTRRRYGDGFKGDGDGGYGAGDGENNCMD